MISILQVRKQILENLRDMSDEDMQRREWTENVKKTWYFPDEIFARWFDDTLKGDYRKMIEEKALTESEWEIIAPFQKKILDFASEYEKDPSVFPANLLNDLRWMGIVLEARNTKEKLVASGW